MKYEEFRKNLNDIKRNALDLVFSFAGKIDEEKFKACNELAKEISAIKEDKIADFAKKLSILPCSSAKAVLIIAKQTNIENEAVILKIKDELNNIYFEEYTKATKNKKTNFAMLNDSSIKNYNELKQRLIDETEIVVITKKLGLNPSEVIGDYKGENKDLQILSKSMKRIKAFTNFTELKNEITVKATQVLLGKENQLIN